MAGYAITAQDINNRAGTVVRNLWEALEEARRMNLWLADANNNSAALQALGVSAADDTVIRSALSDLGGNSGLWAVAHGTYDPTGTNNFFFNAKKLGGVYWTG